MPNLDSCARRIARKAGLVARKSRWRRDSIDNFGKFMLIEPIVRQLPVSNKNLSFDYKAKRFVKSAKYETVTRHHSWFGSFSIDEQPIQVRRVVPSGHVIRLAHQPQKERNRRADAEHLILAQRARHAVD